MKNKIFVWGSGVVIFAIIVFISANIYLNPIIHELKLINETERVLIDKFEIEKKWIINKDAIPYDLFKVEPMKIEQTYICFSPEIRVRRINDGEFYTFAVKTDMTNDGMTREEMEKNITKEEYENLISKKEGNTIHKTRYQLLDGEYLIEIDIFSGELEGLAYLEIEFENQEEANAYQTPDWVIKDVTSDVNYKNGYLARYGIPTSFFEYIK